MSLRWKIAVLCLLLAASPVFFLSRRAVRIFDGFTRRMFEEQMIDYATVVAAEYLQLREAGGPPEAFAARLQAYQKRFRARLQVVGTDGAVRFDSDPDPAAEAGLAGRREVDRALEGRYGARTELSPDRQLFFYHIALPIRDGGGEVIGAARVSANTRDITRAIAGIAREYRRVMLAMLAISGAAAFLFSHTLTRRMRALVRDMTGFAEGQTALAPQPGGRDEIGELGRAFGRMASEIRRHSERQRSLLASTTHELKTPVAAIKGAVEMLRDGGALEDPAACRRFLDNLDISSDRLLRRVEQLVALSNLKTEELRGRKTVTEYAAFVRETVERLYPSPPASLALELPDGLPPIPMIPERIEQVLANLLENAMRYTPPGGTVTVSVRREGGGVATTVRDTGCGIEPADLPRVFEQFFTTVPKRGLKEYGSGLGLAIVQSIVQNHGGDVFVESRAGEGSAFTFTLPG